MPTLPPDSKMAEFSILQAPVNFESWLTVPDPSLVIDEHGVAGTPSDGIVPAPICNLAEPD
jgi:hypothetical protein